MTTLHGTAVCGKTVSGKIKIFKKQETLIKRTHADSIESEIERFKSAKAQAIAELGNLYVTAAERIGKTDAMIFQIHQLMLNDFDFVETIENNIADEGINAQTAVAKACDLFVALFKQNENPVISGRQTDLIDVSERLIRILNGTESDEYELSEPSIIVAKYLTPSDIMQFTPEYFLGFATEEGHPDSHSTIIAKKLELSAIKQVKGIFAEQYDNKNAVLDGKNGLINID